VGISFGVRVRGTFDAAERRVDTRGGTRTRTTARANGF
jgi:hypothetical protein